MKLKIPALLFVAVTFLAPSISYSADRDVGPRAPLVFIENSAITAGVRTKLAAAPLNKLAHIVVGTDVHNAVYLSGNVETQADVDKAVAIARATQGVTAVNSSLQVQQGS